MSPIPEERWQHEVLQMKEYLHLMQGLLQIEISQGHRTNTIAGMDPGMQHLQYQQVPPVEAKLIPVQGTLEVPLLIQVLLE